jgi:hypothetical protein
VGSDSSKGSSWLFRLPLQLESLRRKLPKGHQTEALLETIQRCRDDVNSAIYALTDSDLDDRGRVGLLSKLERHYQELQDALLALGISPVQHSADPLWHFKQLDPIAREHLLAILGISKQPDLDHVLDIKAQEYLAQYTAFEALAEHEGFHRAHILRRGDDQSALVLTLSGSLIQLSRPDDRGARRYLYQNIYGNTHPPQGILLLDRNVEDGHRLRSVELTTSPVRMLRVPKKPMSWKSQSRSFLRLSQTMGSLASVCTGEIAIGDKAMPQAKGLDDLADDLQRFETLRQEFQAQGFDPSEKQTLTQQLTQSAASLAQAAIHRGYNAQQLAHVKGFIANDRSRYRVVTTTPLVVTKFAEGKDAEVLLLHPAMAESSLICGVPLVLIGRTDDVVDILPPILRYWVD